jgi:hypothetical protein
MYKHSTVEHREILGDKMTCRLHRMTQKTLSNRIWPMSKSTQVIILMQCSMKTTCCFSFYYLSILPPARHTVKTLEETQSEHKGVTPPSAGKQENSLYFKTVTSSRWWRACSYSDLNWIIHTIRTIPQNQKLGKDWWSISYSDLNWITHSIRTILSSQKPGKDW